MNSLAQSIVIVGLLAIGETVVIIAGGLDISVGSIASVASVTSAMAVGGPDRVHPRQASPWLALVVGIATGVILGIGNGLIVTVLRVNPIIATLGTLAAYAGLAFLVAPDGKPVGVVTQPDFTVVRDRADPQRPADPGPRRLDLDGHPGAVPVPGRGGRHLPHAHDATPTSGAPSTPSAATPRPPAWPASTWAASSVTMYVLSGAVAGLAGVLLTARTTSGNPINGVGFELQAITAVFLGGAATTGGKGTIMGTVLAVVLVGVLNNGMNLLGIGTFYQRVALGALLIGAVAIAQWRQARAERARTRIAAAG